MNTIKITLVCLKLFATLLRHQCGFIFYFSSLQYLLWPKVADEGSIKERADGSCCNYSNPKMAYPSKQTTLHFSIFFTKYRWNRLLIKIFPTWTFSAIITTIFFNPGSVFWIATDACSVRVTILYLIYTRLGRGRWCWNIKMRMKDNLYV